MGLLGRSLPRATRDALDLRPGERIIAWGHDPASSAYVVATTRALHHGGERTPWDRITRATWEEPVLSVWIQREPGGMTASQRIMVAEAGELPVVVRERVTDSILIQERVDIVGERGARVVARRDSDSGDIRWAVTLDPGLDASDPQVRELADAAVARLRVQLGI